MLLGRVQLAKQRAAERAKERAEWDALQQQEAAAEATRLRAEREAKRASFEAAEAKLQQELAERAAVERRLLAEKETRLREEREREARWALRRHVFRRCGSAGSTMLRAYTQWRNASRMWLCTECVWQGRRASGSWGQLTVSSHRAAVLRTMQAEGACRTAARGGGGPARGRAARSGGRRPTCAGGTAARAAEAAAELRAAPGRQREAEPTSEGAASGIYWFLTLADAPNCRFAAPLAHTDLDPHVLCLAASERSFDTTLVAFSAGSADERTFPEGCRSRSSGRLWFCHRRQRRC